MEIIKNVLVDWCDILIYLPFCYIFLDWRRRKKIHDKWATEQRFLPLQQNDSEIRIICKLPRDCWKVCVGPWGVCGCSKHLLPSWRGKVPHSNVLRKEEGHGVSFQQFFLISIVKPVSLFWSNWFWIYEQTWFEITIRKLWFSGKWIQPPKLRRRNQW